MARSSSSKPRRGVVGIRELKAGLSRYVRRAQSGETIAITDRGRLVAELSPARLPQSDDEIDRRIAELAAEGAVVPARATDATILRRWKGPRLPRGSAQRLLDEQRKDRS